MIRKITLLFLAFLFINQSAKAQRSCGSDIIHQRMMATDPNYATEQAAFRAKYQAFLAANANLPQALKVLVGSGPDTVYEIPVVVHIIHTGGGSGTQYNPSDAMVQAYIDYANQAFAAAYTGYPTPSTGGTRVPLKFVLAKRDTNCNSTGGIVRVNGSSLAGYASDGINLTGSSGAPELSVKNLSRWNTTLYYNIWIVNKIDGTDGYGSGSFTAGYAYYPGSSATLDGTVLLASRVYTGSGATGGGPGDITLPHELGHAFNLKHVFDPFPASSGCPSATNCASTGDEVCDTQPIASSAFGCPGPPTLTCNGVAYDNSTPKNFMDYSNCQDRFTAGQLVRMMYALKSTVQRSTYMTSLGATATSSAPPAACAINTAPNSFNLGVRDVVVSTNNAPAPGSDTLMHVTSDGYNGDGNLGYRDLACKHRLTLTAGQTYKLAVNVGPGTTTSRAKVFIDYNNNGVFTSAEMVMPRSSAGAGYKQVSFTVPTTGISFCTSLRMRVIVDGGSGVNVDSCGTLAFGQAEDYSVYIIGSGGSSGASVTISNPPIGGNPSCFGTTLKFYGVKSAGATVLTYRWLRNGIIMSGFNTDTMQSNIFLNGDQVKVRMLFTSPCGTDSVESSVVTVNRQVTIPPTVTVGIQRGTIPGCIDDTVTFAVTNTVNPGGSPTYRWQQRIPPAVSFSDIAGQTATTFNCFSKPVNTQIRCIMKSSAAPPCAIPDSAISNVFTLTYNNQAPTVSIALTTGTNPGCAGQTLTFTATPTVGGTAPTYVWRRNGTPVVGVTGPTYSGVFGNGDNINCTLTSNSPCAVPTTANSNTITVQHTQITADVSIAQVTPSPSCNGRNVTFSATTINSGTGPLYQWFVNGVAIGTPTGPNFTTPLVNNDTVHTIFIATDPCVLNTTDTSNELVVQTKKSDTASVTMKITIGKDPGCIDSLIEFTAVPVNSGTNPEITWLVNGFPAATGLTFSTSSLLTGDIVQVKDSPADGRCYIQDIVFSKPDTMLRSITLDPPVIHLIGNMIVVDRIGSFVWFGPSGQLSGGTTGQLHPQQIGTYYAVSDNNGCWSKPSNKLNITLLDVNTVDLKGMKVYPNPNNGKITIDWGNKNVDMEINVYNPLGQLVIKDEMRNATRKVVNLESLSNGIYYLMMKDSEGNSGTVKIQVQK